MFGFERLIILQSEIPKGPAAPQNFRVVNSYFYFIFSFNKIKQPAEPNVCCIIWRSERRGVGRMAS